jgi:hypothetical protein
VDQLTGVVFQPFSAVSVRAGACVVSRWIVGELRRFSARPGGSGAAVDAFSKRRPSERWLGARDVSSTRGGALCSLHPIAWPPSPSSSDSETLSSRIPPQVQSELATVDKTKEQEQSFARVSFSPTSEAAINEQIKCVLTDLLESSCISLIYGH